ncbi:hypothetical protein CR513_26315, partial [Mucuna pruriens]
MAAGLSVRVEEPVWVFRKSWSPVPLDPQVTWGLNRGDPHPRPVPKGYFTCVDPHLSWHAVPGDAVDGKTKVTTTTTTRRVDRGAAAAILLSFSLFGLAA